MKNHSFTKANTDKDDAKEIPKEIVGKDGAKMVLIPAGEFQMGTDSAELPELVKLLKQFESTAEASWIEDETPRHTVYVDAFYMDACGVTNAQYKKFVQATGCKEPEGIGLVVEGDKVSDKWGFKPWQDKNYNGDNQPVVCVSWENAKAYAEWVGKRLPTEAEWEKAARGGLAVKRYVWGNECPPPKNSGNFADETTKKAFPSYLIINGYDDGYAYTAPVGSYKPNGYGLYDMAGNVWEWCADCYDNKYYADSPKQNPKGPDSKAPDPEETRVIRGGCWYNLDTFDLRVSRRWGNDPAMMYYDVGFRCVQDVPK